MHNNRILASDLKEKVCTAETAAELIKSGMTVGLSGFSLGFPQAVPLAIFESGKATDLTILCGAATNDTVFRVLGESGAVSKFYGFQFLYETRAAISSGKMLFSDVHLSQFADNIRCGYYGKIDYAIIECIRINEDGGLVPALSAGIVNALVECAEKVIVEINCSIPLELVGIHDFGTRPQYKMKGLLDRMGDSFLPCSPDKISAIVFTQGLERQIIRRGSNELYESIGRNVANCLKREIENDKLPDDFVLQVGTGGVANTVLGELKAANFTGLRMFTEALADPALDFLANGVFSEATTTCLDLTTAGQETVLKDIDFYKNRIVIRPLEVTNNPRHVADMGLVAMNTALELDIYGNVNSSHVFGVNMVNGIGGSNDFSRAARLSIFITPSVAKNGAISCIVPMVTHVDSTEHDTDIVVTEWGYADLRGLAPKERAVKIINNCAHPDYRPLLQKYFDDAIDLCGSTHTPHDLSQTFAWHLRFMKSGTMQNAEKQD